MARLNSGIKNLHELYGPCNILWTILYGPYNMVDVRGQVHHTYCAIFSPRIKKLAQFDE